MRKKILSIALFSVLMLSVCACKNNKVAQELEGDNSKINVELSTEEPTPEELVRGLENITASKDMCIDISTDFGAKISINAEADGVSATADMNAALTVDMKKDKDTVSVEGKLLINALDEEVTQPLNMWLQLSDNEYTVYQYDQDYEKWTRETGDIEDLIEGFEELKAENKKMSLTDVLADMKLTSNDNTYEVVANVDMEKLNETLKSLDELEFEYLESDSDIKLEDMNVSVTMIFHKSSKNIKEIIVELKTDAIEIDNVILSVDEVKLTIKINEISEETAIEIPEDIVEEAVASGQLGLEEIETEEYREEESKNIPEKTTGINANADWKNFSVVIDNKLITIPCDYNKIAEAMGADIKESQKESFLDSGYYALCNMYKDNNLALYIQVSNDTDEMIKYNDGSVIDISQTKYQVEKGAKVVTFPGGLVVGQEIEESKLIELFGEPDKTYEYQSDDSDYWSKEYRWCMDKTWTTTNNYEINVVKGVIDQISINHTYQFFRIMRGNPRFMSKACVIAHVPYGCAEMKAQVKE